MSNIDNRPSADAGRVPLKPRQDVETLLNALRTAAAELRTEDPCLLMTGFFEHLPLPAWIKARQDDGTLVMVHVNRAFTVKTGITSLDYLARHDTEFWPSVFTVPAEAEDHLCLAERKTLAIDKIVPHPTKAEASLRFVGWKWPIMVDGDAVAVCGMAHVSEISNVDA